MSMIRGTVPSHAKGDLLSLVTEAVPLVLFELDAEGMVLRSEGAGRRALGRDGADSVGHSVFDLYADAPDVLLAVRRALVGEAFVTVSRVSSTDGDVVFQTSYVPTFGADGVLEKVTGIALDVTERDRFAGQLRALAARTVRAQERERVRIAHDAHDVLGQILTAVRFDVGWLRRRLDGAGPLDRQTVAARLTELDDRVADGVRAVRDLAVGLRPPDLDTRGLAAAVQTAGSRFERRTGIRTHVHVDLPSGVEAALGADSATALFRILQEAMTNVVRHAEATAVKVGLRTTLDGSSVVLSVEDDGRGFEPHSVREGALGIVGMDERAQAWGGHVDVSTCPGGGTCVRAAFPVGSVLPGGVGRSAA